MFSTLSRDVRHILLGWRRAPAVRLAVVLTVSFAAAAAATIFSVVYAVVWRPLPHDAADRLVVLSRMSDDGNAISRAAYDEFAYWRLDNTVFDDVAVVRSSSYAIRHAQEGSESVNAHVVSSNFFSVLGAEPLVGRLFDAKDDRPGALPVAILSEATWRSAFGSDPEVIGRRLTLLGRRDPAADYVIIGVAAEGSRLHWLPSPALFLPDIKDNDHWDPGAVREVIARLRAGVSIAGATSDFTRLIRQGPYPQPMGYGRLTSLHEAEFGEIRRRLQVLVVATFLVLLLGLVNVTAVLMISGAERKHELATRHALGATRSGLIRLLLTEQVMLSVLGAIVGTVLAFAGTALVVALSPPGVPRIETVHVDYAATLVAVAVSMLVGVLIAVAPAGAATRLALSTALAGVHTIGLQRGRRVRRDALLVAQLSLVLALLVGATLALHSFWKMYTVDLGFDPDRVIAAHVWLGADYELFPGRLADVQSRIVSGISALIDVEEAALSSNIPTALTSYGVVFPDGRRITARNNNVTADYFALLGVPVLEGRALADTDDEYAVLVSRSFARQYFPSSSPVGAVLPASGVNQPRSIVGVVADTWTGPAPLLSGLAQQQATPARTAAALPIIYSRFDTVRWRQANFWLLARVRPGARDASAQIERRLAEIDPSITADMSTLADEARITRLPLRFYSVLLGVVSAVALLLAGIGVIAAARQAARERVGEIGIRIALGATPSAVTWLMLRRIVVLTCLATAAGLVLGVFSADGLRTVLFDLEATSAGTLLCASLLLGLIVAASAYWPIRRASLIDPLRTLRDS